MTTLIHTFAGNIGIGTNDPGSYKLNVNGGVKASSIEINGVSGGNAPIGLIAMWYGTVASIPTGWTLCNGVTVSRTDGGGNITPPDLRGRMVRSAHGDNPATNYPGQSGGSNTVTLTEANLAPHTHTANSGQSNAPHAHAASSGQANAPHAHTASSAAANAPHTHTNQGSGAAHSHYVNGSNAPHVHAYTRFNVRGGEIPVTIFHPQSMAQYGSGQHSWVNGGGANAPHAHNSNNANANHNHTINAANAPHSHTITVDANNATHSHNVTVQANNATHSHTITVSATGQASAVTVTNPYYILAYIMKH